MIKKIVDFMITEGTTQTSECNWIFYFEELAEKFNLHFEWLQDNIDDILAELETRQEVSQADFESDNSISIYFYINAEWCKIELD